MCILNGKVQKNVVLREGFGHDWGLLILPWVPVKLDFKSKKLDFGGEKVPIWDHPIMFRFLFSVSELR